MTDASTARSASTKVTVCIPTIRPDTVSDAIASIRSQRYVDWELVVVGQGPEHAIRPVVDEAAGDDERVRYVHIDRMGASVARNRVFDEDVADIIAFMDDDCEAADDWLEEIVAAFDRHPDVGLVVGSLIRPEPRQRHFRICPQFIAAELLYDPVASGGKAPEGWGAVLANFSIRRSIVSKIGRLDEHLGAGSRFPAAEETDYVLRIEAMGIPMYSTPSVVVRHTHGYRYGLKTVYAHRRAYALGNGALAGKQTLLGDQRGRDWLRKEVAEATVGPLRRFHIHELPVRLVRLAYFASAYRSCVRGYRADPGLGLDDMVRATLQPVGREGHL